MMSPSITITDHNGDTQPKPTSIQHQKKKYDHQPTTVTQAHPQPRSCLLLRLQHQRSLRLGSSSHLYEHFCNRAIKAFSIILNPNNYYYYNSDLLRISLDRLHILIPCLHKDVIVNYHDDLSQHLINFILRSTNRPSWRCIACYQLFDETLSTIS
jgi:hypothetical protein